MTAEEFLEAKGMTDLSKLLFYDSELKTAKDSFCDLLEEYAAEKEKKTWKNVDEETPPENTTVLCRFIGWDDMDCYRTLEYDHKDHVWSDWNGVEHTNVTHWMIINEFD